MCPRPSAHSTRGEVAGRQRPRAPMTLLAYVLNANDGQTPVMGCEAHGRMEKGRREAGVGSLSEVLRGPGVSALQPASSAAHPGACLASGMTGSNPKAHVWWSGLCPSWSGQGRGCTLSSNPEVGQSMWLRGVGVGGCRAKRGSLPYHPLRQAGLTHTGMSGLLPT